MDTFVSVTDHTCLWCYINKPGSASELMFQGDEWGSLHLSELLLVCPQTQGGNATSGHMWKPGFAPKEARNVFI